MWREGREGSGEEAGTVPYTYKCICTLHIVYLSTVLDQSYNTLTSQLTALEKELDQSYKEKLHSLTALEQQYRAWDEARKNRALLKCDTNKK